MVAQCIRSRAFMACIVLLAATLAACGGETKSARTASPDDGGLFSQAIADDTTATALPPPPCPQAAIDQMNVDFGPGTSAITECLGVRDDIRVAVNLSTSTLNPKSGISQTINNVKNLIQNYEGIYSLQLNDGYEIAVVAHFAGARFLLTDDAYNRTIATTTGNPTRADVEALIAKGVPIFMCQNTMRSNGWVTTDLIPGVHEVPGGVAALVDYGLRHWVVLTP